VPSWDDGSGGLVGSPVDGETDSAWHGDALAGPEDTPIEIRIPSLQLRAPIVGVGIDSHQAMYAPYGPAGDPVWQQAFWYRGGGVPGESGTATIAGHVMDVLGRPAAFARLGELRPGDEIVVHGLRNGSDVRYTVMEVSVYSVEEASDPSVLARIFGIGPVFGEAPRPSPDGLSHLTLITCAGNVEHGSFDHRLVVYAVEEQVVQVTGWLRFFGGE
jgi:sortase (surface protein transpeptidase)